MKVFIIAVIVMACTLYGRARAANLSGRVRALQQLQYAVYQLEMRMLSWGLDLHAALCMVAEQNPQPLRAWLECIAQMYDVEAAAPVSDRTSPFAASTKTAFLQPLNTEDITLARHLFDGLGRSDTQQQRDGFRQFQTMLDVQIEQARQIQQAKGRMYRSLGLLGGLLIAIVLV